MVFYFNSEVTPTIMCDGSPKAQRVNFLQLKMTQDRRLSESSIILGHLSHDVLEIPC